MAGRRRHGQRLQGRTPPHEARRGAEGARRRAADGRAAFAARGRGGRPTVAPEHRRRLRRRPRPRRALPRHGVRRGRGSGPAGRRGGAAAGAAGVRGRPPGRPGPALRPRTRPAPRRRKAVEPAAGPSAAAPLGLGSARRVDRRPAARAASSCWTWAWPDGSAAPTGTAGDDLEGTPDYLAPERGGGDPTDGRSDLYALGCTFYHLLTGQPPFPGGDWAAKLLRHRLDAPASVRALRPDLPASVAAVVERLMARDVSDRPATAADAAADLEACMAAAAESGRTESRGRACADDGNPGRDGWGLPWCWRPCFPASLSSGRRGGAQPRQSAAATVAVSIASIGPPVHHRRPAGRLRVSGRGRRRRGRRRRGNPPRRRPLPDSRR